MKAKPRKDQIRLVAEQLFREHGYASTSMRELADSLGIEAASLYNHITSKEEILQDICFSMAESFFQAIEPIEESGLGPVEKLRYAIEAHLGVIAANSNASAVFLHEWRHLGEPFLGDFRLMRRRYEKLFHTVIEEGVRAGVFQPLDATLTARTLLSAINWTYEWYNPNGKVSPSAMADLIRKILLDGIVKK
ncbi:MAG TPA: TetR/AcrR family transcriptional regulator [Candidatus Kapabacteria bacterium]|nr:TetR/AcrR family transcriptional regulator [Candidatus Kapabacteria bacterium]